MERNKNQNENSIMEEAYNTPLGRLVAAYEESLKTPPVGTQETLRTSVAPMYELPKSSGITPMATTPTVPEVEADDALKEMAVENAQPKEYDEEYAKKMVGASLGKLDIKTPEVKGININPSLSKEENPLDKMLGNVADNRKYIYDTLDEDSVRKGEAQRALFDEYAKQKVGAGTLMSGDDLPMPTTLADGEEVYTFGTETLPKNVVDEYLAAWNDDVLHEKRFKEDAEYRNDWMLRHTGKSEERYRNELADHFDAKLDELEKNAWKDRPSLYRGLGYAQGAPANNNPIGLDKIKKAREVVNTLRKNNFGAGFAEGFDLGNILTLDLKDLGTNVALIKALNKDTRGEQLNANEKALVEAWSITQDAEEAMETLGGRSMGANVGHGLAYSIGAIPQFAATQGIATSASKGISRAAAKVALKRAMNTVTNKGIGSALKYGSLKVAESAVGNLARVPFAGSTYRNYTDKRLNQFQLEERLNEATGKMEKVIGKQETSALKDAIHSFVESYFEFQSEDFGQALDFGVKAFAKSLPRKNKLHQMAVSGLSGPVKGGIPRYLRETAKIGSLGAEVLEEAVNDVATNTLHQDDEGWKRMATWQYWWELLCVSTMLSSGFGVINYASNTSERRQVKALIDIRKRSLDNIDNEALRKHLNDASLLDDLTERSKMLASLDWGNTLSREDMANAIDFINAQTKLDVIDYSASEAERLDRMTPYLERLSIAARDGEISDADVQRLAEEAYTRAFRVQENQQDLARIADRIRVATEAGISAKDINSLIANAGLKVYNVGDEVEMLDGTRGSVNRVLAGAYEVIDEDGDIEVYQFEEVLQPSPEVREAQLATTEQTEGAEAQAEPTQQDVADKAVAEAVETARAQADKIKNKDDEKVYTAKLEGGTEGYIINGKGLEIGSDGRIVKSEIGTVIFKPLEGEAMSVSTNEVRVTDATSVEDILNVAAESARAMAQSVAEAQQSETQYPEDAAYIATDDGSRKIYVLKGQDIEYDKENGEIKSPHVVKVRIDGGEPIDFPAKDLMIDEEIAPAQQAEQTQVTETAEMAEAPADVVQPTQPVVQEASTETPAPAIPTLKNGRPDYNAMSPEMFAEQYTAAYGAEKTVKLAQANIADADKVIADLEKKQDSLIDPNKIDEVQVKLEEAKAREARYEAVLNIMNTPKTEPIATEAQSEVAEVETQPTEEAQPQVEEAQAPEVEAVEDPKQGLRQRIAAWEDKLGVPVKVIERVEDIENAKAREAIESGVNVTGWYDKNTGEVYFYLPNVVDTQEVDSTIVHEIVAHKGLEQMLGKETFGALCDRVWDMMSEKDRNTFLTYPGVNGDYRKAADEYIAHLAERTDLTAAETTIWQEIVNFIREAIAKIASDVQLTNEDIEDLIRASYRNLAATRLEAQGAQVDVEKGDVLFAVKDVLSGNEREKAIKDIMAVTGRSRDEVEKYLKAEESLAKVILDGDNVAFLDLQIDESVPSIWENSDYPQGTVEFSNICRKRLPFTMIYQRLQKEFPNTVFDASTLETIRGVLKANGVDVACGLCFVEDRRQLLGEIGQEFIDAVRGNHTTTNENQISALEALKASGDTYIPDLYELLTLDGMKMLRETHPEVAVAFIRYNNARGMQAGRLFQAYSAYHREIRKFNKARVKRINDNGGLRIFSFSDFEAHHLIDLVQVLTDCASKGIKVQGYTKVPEFARAVKNTKMKVNRSLIAKDKGYVEDGYVPKKNEAVSPNAIGGKRLLLDTVEGINVNDENFFDSTDSPSIGNILVGINDEQIRLAMADPFVDYIIPFHTGIKKETLQQKGIGDWVNYKNYQVEKVMGANGKLKKAPTHINIYTDVLSDDITNEKQFVKRYLEVCREKGYVPKFPQFLKTNAKGEYVYTKGYYKFLIDFKLFDKSGRILPQEAVVPVFDNAFNKQILNKYVADEKAKAPNDEVYAEVKEALGLEDVSFRVKEREDIERKAKENGTWLKAPNGKDTNLTPEQWVTTRTKAFKNWAGDWENDPENATKILDENGEPKIVYHQTNATVYINRETGQNWDELDWRERMEWEERDDWEDYWEEQDFYTFTRVNARTTNEFDGFFFAPEYDEYHEYGNRTIAAFLNIRKPASNKDYNIDSTKNNAGREERIRLQEEGFDGVIREYDGVIDEYIAFEPSQIKSAEGNTGFDTNNDDIRFRVTPEMDKMYMDAVESGNIGIADALVSSTAKKAGYNSPRLYSGSDAFGFTKIDTKKFSDDGISFWASDSEATASSYTANPNVRELQSDIDDEIDISEQIDDEIHTFRRLIDRTFSEWVFGQTNDSELRYLYDNSNFVEGHGDGVYDKFINIVYDTYYDYKDELENPFEDADEWFEKSEEGQKLMRSILTLEGLKRREYELSYNPRGGIMQLYASTEGMIEIECNGKEWDALRPKELPERERPYKTRDVVRWAKENGWKGVIFKNILDTGKYGGAEESDVYAFIDPFSQVKSADAVTYDDNGNVIPLSERFNKSESDIRFRFIGEIGASNLDKAEEATMRIDDLKVAREMEASGKDAKEIKMATGWERGADSKWRYEVLDIKILPPEEWVNKRGSAKLPDIIAEDNGLFVEYPELRKVKVKKSTAFGGGSYLPKENTIVIGVGTLKKAVAILEDPSRFGQTEEGFLPTFEVVKSETEGTLVHEIQHIIQNKEGFAKGGSSQMTHPKYDKDLVASEYARMASAINDKIREYNSLPVSERRTYKAIALRNNIENGRKNLAKFAKSMQLGDDGYRKLGGEVEARNVEKRKGYTMAQRLATLARETEDVSRKDQIFIFDAIENSEKAIVDTVRFRVGDNAHDPYLDAQVDKKHRDFVAERLERADTLDADALGSFASRMGKGVVLNEQRAKNAIFNKDRKEREAAVISYKALGDYSRKLLRAKYPDYKGHADNLAEGKSTLEVVKSLFEKYNTNEANAKLFDLIYPIAQRYGVRVEIELLPQIARYGESAAGKVTFDVHFLNSELEPDHQKASVILHELIHSVTQNAIYLVEEPEVQAVFGKPSDALVAAVENLKTVHQSILADEAFKGEYGLKNIHDVLAELSNPKFVAKLKQHKLFATFIDAIRRVVTAMFPDAIFEHSNAYEEVETSLLDILNNTPIGLNESIIRNVWGEPSNVRFRVAPTFYSNAENAVKSIKQEKATPEQWLKMIEKNGGLKSGEDKWLRLSDWLKDSEKKTLTKQEVLDYINENQIQIEEVKYSEFGPGLIDEATRKLESEMRRIGIEAMRDKYPDFDDYFEVLDGELVWSENNASEGEYEDYIIENKIVDVDPSQQGINESRLSYTTKGLTNKREIALTVPTIEPWNEGDQIHFGDAGEGRAIAWIRFGDTTDEYGFRVLVIDEIQSKRHQEGRERGYATDVTEEQVKKAREEADVAFRMLKSFDEQMAQKYGARFWADQCTNEEYAHWKLLHSEYDRYSDAYYDLYDKHRSTIPAAPFEKNWHELAMKRMLRYAAENGYDAIAWTKGDQQAERYNIGSVVQRITSYEDGGNRMVIIRLNNNEPLNLKVDSEGKIVSSNREIGANTLSDVVGKELAVKIMNNEGEDATYYDGRDIPAKVIAGEGLRIGGEGMRGFYDQILPSFINKYGKKWGVKVQDVTLPFVEEAGRTMHSVDVTDAMRESVMEGQPMFRVGDIEVQEDTATEETTQPTEEEKKAAEAEKRMKSLARLQKSVRDLVKKLHRSKKDDADIAKMIAEALEAEVSKEGLQKFLDTGRFIQEITLGISRESIQSALNRMSDQIANAVIKHRKELLEKTMGIQVQSTTSMGIAIAHGVDDRTRAMIELFRRFHRLSKPAPAYENSGLTIGSKVLEVTKSREDFENFIDSKESDVSEIDKMDLMRWHTLWSEIAELEDAYITISLDIDRQTQRSKELYQRLNTVQKGSEAEKALKKDRKLALEAKRNMARERLDAKQQIAQKLGDLLTTLSQRIKVGREARKGQKAVDEKYRKDYLNRAMEDVRVGNKVKAYDDGITEEELKKKKQQQKRLGFRKEHYYSFVYMVQSVSVNAIEGRGFLYDTLIEGEDGVMACQNREIEMNNADESKIYEFAKQLGFRNLDEFANFFDQPLIYNGQQYNLQHENIYEGSEDKRRHGRVAVEEVPMTVGYALYLVMMAEQPSIAPTITKGMRLTSDEIDILRSALSKDAYKRAMDFKEFAVDMLHDLREDRYNQASLDRFGTQLDNNENYFPVRRLTKNLRTKQVDLDQITSVVAEDAKASVTASALIKRVKSYTAIDVRQNPLRLMMDHIHEMNHFAATAPVVRNVEILLNSQSFKEQLNIQKNELGQDKMNNYDRFELAAALAVGSFKPKTNTLNDILAGMQSMVSAGKVSFRFYTAAKQVLSLPAFMAYSPSLKYQALLLKNLFGFVSLPKKEGEKRFTNVVSWCMQNLPTYAERWKEKHAGDERIQSLKATKLAKWMYRTHFTTRATMKFIEQIGMWANASVDIFVCGVGAHTIYEYEVSRLKAQGMAATDAEALAKRRAAIGFNESQQSSLNAFMSPAQRQKDLQSLATAVFENSNRSYGRKASIAGDYLRTELLDEKLRKKRYDLEVKRETERLETQMRNKLKAQNNAERNLSNRLSDEQIEEQIQAKREDIAKEAERNASAKISEARRRAGAEWFVYKVGLNYLWKISPMLATSMFMLGDDDEDKEGLNDYSLSLMLKYLAASYFRNGVGGATFEGFVDGYGFSNMLTENTEKLYLNISKFVEGFNEEDAEVDWQSFRLALNAVANLGVNFDAQTFYNFYKGIHGMIYDREINDEDILRFISAPKSLINATTIPINEGESEHDYVRRLAYLNSISEDEADRVEGLYKDQRTARDRSKLSKLNKWAKNYRAISEAKMLDTPYERSQQGSITVPMLEDLDDEYKATITAARRTRSGSILADVKEYTHLTGEQKKRSADLAKTIRRINRIEGKLEKTEVSSPTYKEMLTEMIELKKSVVARWNK